VRFHYALHSAGQNQNPNEFNAVPPGSFIVLGNQKCSLDDASFPIIGEGTTE
jgi:hypothetical protein